MGRNELAPPLQGVHTREASWKITVSEVVSQRDHLPTMTSKSWFWMAFSFVTWARRDALSSPQGRNFA